jgi:hypothetical protein
MLQEEAAEKMSLVSTVQAPSRAWLQSFLADLKVDRRHVRGCLISHKLLVLH